MKDKVLQVQMSQENYKKLQAIAKSKGLTLAAYARMLLLNKIEEENK